MPKVTYEEVRELRNQLDEQYRGRHEDFQKLRKFWHGRYWDMAVGEGGGSTISSVFRELGNRRADVGPDLKLIHNVLQEVCVKYQTFLGPLPQIRVFVDSPESENRRAQATLKERFLYGIWSENKMSRLNNQIAWYLPLMGDCFLGIYPDMDKNMPRALLRSPEYAYPVPTIDGHDAEEAVIFSWCVKESVARRQFPEYTPIDPPTPRFYQRKTEPADPDVWIYEYSDCDYFGRWVGDQQLVDVEHELGVNLFEHAKFIDVPGEAFGHGAVEQAVGLVEMGNALHSLMFQAVLENVFPRLVLIDPSKAPEIIDNGPGSVIPINQGGDAKWLTSPSQGMLAQMGFQQENERIIKQATSMPDVNFGQFHASIVTGKAINELQGAGTGSVVEMVQGVGIGPALVAWNEKAIGMAQTIFRDDKIQLMGTRPGSMYDVSSRPFALTLKGKDIVGSNRNEVIFSPALGLHEKLVMNLQAYGAGMISLKYAREQQGIPDNAAMEEEIIGEKVEGAVLEFILQQMAQEPTPEKAAEIEKQATSYIEGNVPHPLLALPPGPAGAAPGPAPGAGGPVPPGPAPPGPPAPTAAAGGGGPPPPQAANTVTVDQAVERFHGLQGIQGRVWLMGEIVANGQTSDLLEIGLTDGADRQQIATQIPEWAPMMRFHHVTGEPAEQAVEVTPNATAQQGAPQANVIAASLNPPQAVPA